MAMTFEEYEAKHLHALNHEARRLVRMGWNARASHGNCQGILDSSASEVPEGLDAAQEEWARINGRKHIADASKMVVNLKPIAESKVRQLGGDVCGVLVRNEAGAWAAVSEGGRVMWLDDFEGQPSSAQGGQGAEAVGFDFDGWYDKHESLFRDGVGKPDLRAAYKQGYRDSQPQPAVPEWMRGLSENLATQNNRITQDPLFVVFQKREIVVDEEFDHDRISWGNEDGEVDDHIQDRLNEMYDDIDGDFWREDEIELTDEETGTGTYRRVALKEVDEFVTACFTEVGANDYLEANGHNLTRPHIYVTSLYRNEEMKRLREWLLSTPTTPQADGWVRCEDRLPEPRRQSRKTPNGILAKHESGRITQFRDVTETLLQYMRNGPRKPTKFEQPVSERITEWMDLDAERAGGED